MGIDYSDLNYTVIKNRVDRKIVDNQNENDYNYSDGITPHHFS